MADGPSTNRLFDRFAEAASEFASHAAFFIGCVLLVVIWVPSYFVLGNLNTWQLVINTATTIVTFLLVALLQRTPNGEATTPSITNSTRWLTGWRT